MEFQRGQKKLEVGEVWARLYVSHSEESAKALQILRERGFYVTALPVSGIPGPELKIGREVYRGLSEIKGFLKYSKY